ncbi:MAG: helix-turn-helix domain-containing protein, partial [Candidatus Dormibacteraceae bacterium]
MPQLNEQLRQARKQRGWRLKDVVAEIDRLGRYLGDPPRLGVEENAIGRWERGVVEPSDFYKARICLVYKVESPEELGWGSLPVLLRAIEGMKKHLPSEPMGELAAMNNDRKEDSLTRPFDPSRRTTLRRLLETGGFAATALPSLAGAEILERQLGANPDPSKLSQDSYHALEQLVVNCWQLLDQGSPEVSKRVLDAVLSHLMEIAPGNREVAKLAVYGLHLRSILCAHLLQLNDKIASCQQAVQYAGLSGDPSALSVALTELAFGYRYAHNPVQSLAACEAALQSCGQASPLLRSRLYAASAAAYGQAGRATEAKHYISLAYEGFPTTPERDPHYTFAETTGISIIAFYEGIMHLELGQPKEADRALESYLQ